MQRENIPESLLADVKNYLNITWDDEAADAKVSGLIAPGEVKEVLYIGQQRFRKGFSLHITIP